MSNKECADDLKTLTNNCYSSTTVGMGYIFIITREFLLGYFRH